MLLRGLATLIGATLLATFAFDIGIFPNQSSSPETTGRRRNPSTSRAAVTRPQTTAKPAPLNSVDLIVSDQQRAHNGVLPLHPLVDWKNVPVIQAGNNATSMGAAVTWGVLFADGRPANAALRPETGNTRVQVRGIQTWLLSKATGSWHLVADKEESGGAYPENFGHNNAGPINVRSEPEGISARLDFSSGRNAWHFWNPRGTLDQTDIAAMYGTFQARLILDDPNGPDDRGFWSSRLLAGAGLDYWKTLGSPWPTNRGASIGRFKFVTPQWRAFNTTTATAQQLRATPPPLAEAP